VQLPAPGIGFALIAMLGAAMLAGRRNEWTLPFSSFEQSEYDQTHLFGEDEPKQKAGFCNKSDT
jgi:PGF-CTERM protein